jgi:hypothetical protein
MSTVDQDVAVNAVPTKPKKVEVEEEEEVIVEEKT